MCDRVLVCSHACEANCTLSCPPCFQECENRCKHSYCPKKCGEICFSCRKECPWKCPHYKCTKLCRDLCNRPRCNKPCNKRLKCGRKPNFHRCRGLCGEVCICAVCEKNGGEEDEDALFIQLPDCKHIFSVSDLDR